MFERSVLRASAQRLFRRPNPGATKVLAQPKRDGIPHDRRPRHLVPTLTRVNPQPQDLPKDLLPGAPGLPGKVAPKKVFGVLGLAIFTFSFLANVNTTPMLAKFGLGSILLFLMAILLFLTPTAMASGEMASTWPRTGGIYVWTRMAFGEGLGFMVIWLEWGNFVVAWPGLMGTITLQSSYVIDPALDSSPAFIVPMVIGVTWLCAGLALRGLRVARGFAWYSVIGGTVIPAVILVVLAVVWLAQGHAPAMEISAGALVPDLSFSDVAFISGALLMFSGIEISAVHAGDVRNPGKTIPRANLIAVLLCFLLFAPLTLALAAVIPSDQIDIVVGLVQDAETVFNNFGIGWLTDVFAFLVVSGLVAALVQIVNGPSRGLLVAGREGGNLPPVLQRENRNKMPIAIILTQATVSSVLALGYGVLGSVQNAWFMFALIQTNMTLIMYVLMFASVIKLRFSKPSAQRPYRIPFGKAGLFAITGVGLMVCIVGVLISLSPTDEASGMSTGLYITVLALGTVAFVAMPFIFWIFRKPSWKANAAPLDIDVEALTYGDGTVYPEGTPASAREADH